MSVVMGVRFFPQARFWIYCRVPPSLSFVVVGAVSSAGGHHPFNSGCRFPVLLALSPLPFALFGKVIKPSIYFFCRLNFCWPGFHAHNAISLLPRQRLTSVRLPGAKV